MTSQKSTGPATDRLVPGTMATDAPEDATPESMVGQQQDVLSQGQPPDGPMYTQLILARQEAGAATVAEAVLAMPSGTHDQPGHLARLSSVIFTLMPASSPRAWTTVRSAWRAGMLACRALLTVLQYQRILGAADAGCPDRPDDGCARVG
jgi:hypothetical protein